MMAEKSVYVFYTHLTVARTVYMRWHTDYLNLIKTIFVLPCPIGVWLCVWLTCGHLSEKQKKTITYIIFNNKIIFDNNQKPMFLSFCIFLSLRNEE